jgi:hypothetical protein
MKKLPKVAAGVAGWPSAFLPCVQWTCRQTCDAPATGRKVETTWMPTVAQQ